MRLRESSDGSLVDTPGTAGGTAATARLHADHPGGIKPTAFCSLFSVTAHQNFACLFFLLLLLLLSQRVSRRPDVLSKDEFHLKQKVEPFIHYKEKHGSFECVTHQNIEAVAAKVRFPTSDPSHLPPEKKKQTHKQLKQKRPHLCHLGSHCRANTACWRRS